MTVQCCVCHRIKEGDKWEEAAGLVLASHTYCPNCLVTKVGKAIMNGEIKPAALSTK
jgi:hypothetical protein